MIIPWRTDAPIYHWPIATLGLIVVNVLAFAAELSAPQEVEGWILSRGDGLHPLQWLTSNFLHADWWHLIGNMIFLWAFGIVVEGEIGWWRFLAVYLGIGIARAALEQTVLLASDAGRSLGASSAIFGLLAMTMVWAPKNEMSCVMLLGFRPVFFDVSHLTLGVVYVLLDVVGLVLSSMSGEIFGTSALHLSGAAFGFIIATVMVKMDWVDCENWDLYAVLAGREGGSRTERKPRPLEPAEAAQLHQNRQAAALAHLRRHLTNGDAEAARTLYATMNGRPGGWSLPQAELKALVKLLLERQCWAAAVPVMVQHLRRFPEQSHRMRLTLAQLLIQHQRRPAQALRVMAKIPAGTLNEALEQTRRKLEAHARKLQDEGELEAAAEDW